MVNESISRRLENLVQLSVSLGASDAQWIASGDIVVEDRLAQYCREPRCEHYGLSPSCPPHVSGPTEFRKLQKALNDAIVVRIVVPAASLFSDEKREIMRLLHEIVAGIEREAKLMGYGGSIAFAGGSCKNIFCHSHLECRRLKKNGECRYPDEARPSMSGFGINVSELMNTCGWPNDIRVRKTDANEGSMSWVAGLVLVG